MCERQLVSTDNTFIEDEHPATAKEFKYVHLGSLDFLGNHVDLLVFRPILLETILRTKEVVHAVLFAGGTSEVASYRVLTSWRSARNHHDSILQRYSMARIQ